MRNRAVLAPTVALQVGKTAELALQFALSIILARVLMPESYGLYALASSVAAIAMLLAAAGTEESLERTGHDENDRRVVLLLRMSVLSAMLLVGIPLALLLGFDAKLVVATGWLAFSGSLLSLANSWVVIARRSWSTLLSIVAGAGVSLALSATLLPLFTSFLVAAIFVSAGQIIAASLLLSQSVAQRKERASGAARSWREMTNLTFAGSNLLAAVVGKQLGVLAMASAGVSTVIIGYFSLAFTLATLASGALISGIGAAAFRKMSVSESSTEVTATFRLTSEISLVLGGVPLVFLISNAHDVLNSVFGEQYSGGSPMLVVLAGGMLLSRAIGGGTSQSVLYQQGRERVSLLVRVSVGALAAVLSFALVFAVGPIGVVIVASCASAVINIVEFFVCRINWRMAPIWRAGLPVGVSAFIPFCWTAGPSLVSLGLQGSAMVGVAGGGYLMLKRLIS